MHPARRPASRSRLPARRSPPGFGGLYSIQLSYGRSVIGLFHVFASNIHVRHPARRPGYKINPFILPFGPHFVRSVAPGKFSRVRGSCPATHPSASEADTQRVELCRHYHDHPVHGHSDSCPRFNSVATGPASCRSFVVLRMSTGHSVTPHPAELQAQIKKQVLVARIGSLRLISIVIKLDTESVI